MARDVSRRQKDSTKVVVLHYCGNHCLSLMSVASYKKEANILKQIVVDDEEYDDGFDN